MSGTTGAAVPGDTTSTDGAKARGRTRFLTSAWWRSGLSFWSSAADAPLLRRPTDAVLLVLGTLLLAVLTVPAPGPGPIDTAFAGFMASLPGDLRWIWEFVYSAALLWTVVLILAALLARRRRLLFLKQVLAVVLALVVAGVVAVYVLDDGSWTDVWNGLVTHTSTTVYPAVRLGVVTAVVAVTSSHLAKPHRRVGIIAIVLGGVGAVGLGIDTLLGLAGGLTLGVTVAAAVNLAFGSPGGHVPLELLEDEVRDLGVEPGDLAYEKVPLAVVARGTDADGGSLLVRVYGRDAWEASLFASLWQRLWYRRASSSSSAARQSQAEHEALLALLAQRAGVPVQPVIAAGSAWGRDALLVRRDDGRVWASIPAGEITEAHVRSAWAALVALHGAGIAHGEVDGAALSVQDDGSVLITDLADGQTSPDDSAVASDDAHMLVTTALAVGVDDAVRVAREVLGDDELVATAAFLQPAAFDSDVRKLIKAAPWKMKELREAVVSATGAEAPPLEKLRRVSPASVAMLIVLVLVIYAVIGAIAGVGWSNLVAEFQGANWWWVLGGTLLAVGIYVGQAIALQGAAAQRLPLVPVVGLEMSVGFLGLAVPSSAAKIGLTIRFLQLAGGNPTAAVAISLIDSLAGFAIQVLVIVLTLFTGVVTLTPTSTSGVSIGSSLANVNWGLVGFLAVVLLVVAVLVIRFVPKARAFVAARTAESRDSLRVLRSPRNVLRIFSGALMWNVVAALVLGCSLKAFGAEASFAELILVNTLVALFAGLMPIPGNVGVMEAALTWGLTAIGIDQTVAMSTAIVYRICTFYVPAAYGFLSLKLMRARSYL